MNRFVCFFIYRPVATTLLSIGLCLIGLLSCQTIRVANLPDMSYMTINVRVDQAGSTPEQMASSIIAPLERYLGQIASVEQIESESHTNVGYIRIDFARSRDIDAAFRDVQSALRNARADLPKGTLDQDPVATKGDPAVKPIFVLSVYSDTLTLPALYEVVRTRVQPELSEVPGVGQVILLGSSPPAVRVDLNPYTLFKWGIGLEDVKQALASANADTPKGFIEAGGQRYMLATNDRATKASQYRDLVIGYRNSINPVRLSSVATVTDSVQDLYQGGYFNGRPAIALIVRAQPRANAVAIVDVLKERIKTLHATLPPYVTLEPAIDLSLSIRASLTDMRKTLAVSILMTVGLIVIFLRRPRAVFVPVISLPVTLLFTITAMAWQHFTLDIISLMAVTISVGFIVDDTVVVLENITRHMEAGEKRLAATVKSTSEIAFTLISITASLAATFIPFLFVSGAVGTILYEFAMTIISTLIISLVLSLTLTPMLCAYCLEPHIVHRPAGKMSKKWSYCAVNLLNYLTATYERSLQYALRHHVMTVLALPISTVFLLGSILIMPKTDVPPQDIALIGGSIRGDDTMSFSQIMKNMHHVNQTIKNDPDVVTVSTWNTSRNEAQLYAQLKDRHHRNRSDLKIIDDIRKKLTDLPGVHLSLFSAGNTSGGGGQRQNGTYRFILHDQKDDELRLWVPRLVTRLRQDPMMVSVSSTVEGHGAAIHVKLRRDVEARYLITPQLVSNTLHDAYGQAIVSRIHDPASTRAVVMEVAEDYRNSPDILKNVWISTAAGTPAGAIASNQIRVKNTNALSTAALISENALRNSIANQITGNKANGSPVSSSVETMIPLANVADLNPEPEHLTVEHWGNMASTEISFDLIPGKTHEEARRLIKRALADIHAPPGLSGSFSGIAGQARKAQANEYLAFMSTLVVMYIVLGVLYESLIHPFTILSTLPSAGCGAILALWIDGSSLSTIAVIGILLVTGLVQKNAILVIDFAITANRVEKRDPRLAITQACVTRFRPIIMTTLVTICGAIPFLFGQGYGAEMRRPLGVAIIGGMLISQMLTLYTTPIIYLYMEAMSRYVKRLFLSLPLYARRSFN